MNAAARPKSYWLIAVIALLWNLLGVLVFLLTIAMTPEQAAAMPDAQREVYEATPSWINVLWGAAVAAGVLGAFGLLLRKRWAVMLFMVSLVMVVLQIVGSFAATPAWSLLGPSSLVMPAVILLIALGLWLYAKKADARGWLG
ncbi:hypothetical protein [Marilutibacter alkalisoli]|uniref:Sugar transporter n=1 Tax=Marilutibacter alkalisoli TaxID=2591633 RepID=A0A514BUR2_9GAMM|nr:hypothetical protein [Lysobacter alkalisoli]QDH71141.1 hypothetical protein FKV23_14385 [Lysobacter alkalisoli]